MCVFFPATVRFCLICGSSNHRGTTVGLMLKSGCVLREWVRVWVCFETVRVGMCMKVPGDWFRSRSVRWPHSCFSTLCSGRLGGEKGSSFNGSSSETGRRGAPTASSLTHTHTHTHTLYTDWLHTQIHFIHSCQDSFELNFSPPLTDSPPSLPRLSSCRFRELVFEVCSGGCSLTERWDRNSFSKTNYNQIFCP